jgi:hypothetical protein
MTKADVVKKMGLDKETFDYALPQDWVNEVRKHLPEELKEMIVPNFVWLYDEKARMSGRPCSLSFTGNKILSVILCRPTLHLSGRYYEEKNNVS